MSELTHLLGDPGVSFTAEDDFQALNDLFLERGWGDGLPIIPPTLDRVEAFVEFVKSGQFFEYFPEYRGRVLKPVFSSLSIPESLVAYLTRQGVYAVAMGDEVMQVLNLKEVGE